MIMWLLMQSLFISTILGLSSNHTNETSCLTNNCFYQHEDACPNPESNCHCQLLPHCGKAAICCNVNKFQLSEGLACANITGDNYVEALHIRNANLSVLNLSLSSWRRLKYMTVTDGHIDNVQGEFAKLASVSCLNLSSNHISQIENRSLVNLYNLSYLDLSHNNLSEVYRFNKMDRKLFLDISDNPYMTCTSIIEALNRTKIYFVNENETTCSSPSTYNWFNSTEHVPILEAIKVHEVRLRRNCTKNCTCSPQRLDIVSGKTPKYVISVNCFGLGLEALPHLPDDTYSLNISNNKITSLEPLKTDPSYQYLRELYADNNLISSILPLEGSTFISNFVLLSLKNNTIRSIPTYVLSNILDRNYNSRHVSLALNHLDCDCNTAKALKAWILTKQKQIADPEEIYCKNLDQKVLELNPSQLCQSKQDWTDYIYYIIALELLLFIGLIAKVSYDYWVFKTAGYLPWPASKMPKLPCDWLCE